MSIKKKNKTKETGKKDSLFTQYFEEVEKEMKKRYDTNLPLNTNTVLRGLQNGSYFQERRRKKKRKKGQKRQGNKKAFNNSEYTVLNQQRKLWRDSLEQGYAQNKVNEGFKGFGPSRKLMFDFKP